MEGVDAESAGGKGELVEAIADFGFQTRRSRTGKGDHHQLPSAVELVAGDGEGCGGCHSRGFPGTGDGRYCQRASRPVGHFLLSRTQAVANARSNLFSDLGEFGLGVGDGVGGHD